MHIHRNGYAHCDIKSLNILIDDYNGFLNCVITDFGIVRILADAKVLTQFDVVHVKGATMSYAAPESLLLMNDAISSSFDFRKFDVYSFGIMMYRLIALQLPWKNGSASQQQTGSTY